MQRPASKAQITLPRTAQEALAVAKFRKQLYDEETRQRYVRTYYDRLARLFLAALTCLLPLLLIYYNKPPKNGLVIWQLSDVLLVVFLHICVFTVVVIFCYNESNAIMLSQNRDALQKYLSSFRNRQIFLIFVLVLIVLLNYSDVCGLETTGFFLIIHIVPQILAILCFSAKQHRDCLDILHAQAVTNECKKRK